jgi:hypothetical protein
MLGLNAYIGFKICISLDEIELDSQQVIQLLVMYTDLCYTTTRIKSLT